ncbi:NifZ domain-containing protein [Paraburkholderia sp. RAU2J]|nr:NifZ domain-containing protein [Paraburkholderia sp. RAU2J]
MKKVTTVAARIPQLTVLGIAGPGDSLANPKKTFDTFKNSIVCVTITINMVDPVVGEKIYPWIFWDHRRITGKEAACFLHARQMEGLEMLTTHGVLTKINSVLIPGINDELLIEVNREVKRRGAFLHNIMPMISDPEHGTYFGLHGQRGPTARELKAVHDACKGGANLMRHCRQCRADGRPLPISNDGTYTGKAMGELLLSKGDVGYVTGIDTFLQWFYIYAVHFVERDHRVGMRAKELCTLDHRPQDVPARLGERAPWRMRVVALHDVCNDGGYPRRGECERLVRAGALGGIANVGRVIETGEPVYLVEFDGQASAALRTKLILPRCDH